MIAHSLTKICVGFVLGTSLTLSLPVLAQDTAQSADPEQRAAVDALLEASQARYGTVGYSVAILQDDEVVYQRHGGVVDRQSGVVPDTHSVYPVYSATKLFFNVAFLQAAGDGLVSFDEALGETVPGLPDPWQGISLRLALSHASGLPEYYSRPAPADVETALASVFTEAFQFEPGTSSAYTQTNYALAKLALEARTGEDLESFLRTRQFEPLGLDGPEFSRPGTAIDNFVTSYASEAEGGGARPPMSWREYHFSGTGLNLSLDGFTRWAQALVRGDLVAREDLVDHWQGVDLVDGQRSRFSHGWEFEDHGDIIGVGHGGGGRVIFRHYFRRDEPATSVTVIYLDNGGAQYFSQSRLARRMAAVFMPELSND